MKGTQGRVSFGEKKQSSGVRTLVVFVLISILLITLTVRESAQPVVDQVRATAQAVVAPFKHIGTLMEQPFTTLGNIIHNATTNPEALDELERKNELLTAQLAEYNEYKAENERLRSLFALTSSYHMRGVAVHIIDINADTWNESLIIDAGSNVGITPDMPVVDGAGIIGQVAVVSATTSYVRQITDPEFQVSALLQSSRTRGILRGSLDGSLHLEYIPSTETVSVGDIVVTSGLGGVYPTGLLIGTVANVAETSKSLYYDITVTPAANVENQEEVFVVFDYTVSGSTVLAPEERVVQVGE